MRRVFQISILAIVFAALLPLAAKQFGRQMAERQADLDRKQFQQQLDDALKSGAVVIERLPNGRTLYKNSSLTH